MLQLPPSSLSRGRKWFYIKSSRSRIASQTGAGGGRGGAAEFKNSVQSRKRKRKAQQTSRNKEEERQIKEWVESLPGADLGGYFPLRGDFEVEHDNAAEEVKRAIT